MKESTKNIVLNALSYLLIAMTTLGILFVTFQLGVVKGMADAYKTQLKKQIEMLEEEKHELLKQQVLNEKQ